MRSFLLFWGQLSNIRVQLLPTLKDHLNHSLITLFTHNPSLHNQDISHKHLREHLMWVQLRKSKFLLTQTLSKTQYLLRQISTKVTPTISIWAQLSHSLWDMLMCLRATTSLPDKTIFSKRKKTLTFKEALTRKLLLTLPTPEISTNNPDLTSLTNRHRLRLSFLTLEA